MFAKGQYVHVELTGRVKSHYEGAETVCVEVTKADGFHMLIEVPAACVELAEAVDRAADAHSDKMSKGGQ